LVLVVLTSLTLITLDSRSGRTGPIGVVGRVAHAVVSPLQRATSSIASPIGDWWSGVTDSGNLKRENRKLRAQITDLQNQQRQAEVALAQDAELKRLLGLQLLPNARGVTARVIDRDPGNFESTLTIDRGQEHGIEKDMAVVSSGGVVGHVIDSWHGGAKVRVLTDPESAIAVRTVALHSGTGIAQGRLGSRELTVADFPAGAVVHKGDTVVTADLENSIFPPDLVVGTVTSVDEKAAGLGSIVQIRPSVDFDAIQFVEVLRWVPGQGPVVAPTTTTTTTTPGATTTTTPGETTTTNPDSTTTSAGTTTSGP
jgi:rod shape-determining protein MreC